MQDFNELIHIIETLLSPQGCPWDREQTFQSLRRSLIEETYEVVEAIDLQEYEHLKEELGDLMFNIIFLCELGKTSQLFTIQEVLKTIKDKLIRRHPHVFGDAHVSTSDEVIEQWEAIKRKEKTQEKRKSLLDGIPKDLPVLARAQHVLKKIKKSEKNFQLHPLLSTASQEEKDGQWLWEMLQEMSLRDVQADQALRKRLTQIEQEFRDFEQT